MTWLAPALFGLVGCFVGVIVMIVKADTRDLTRRSPDFSERAERMGLEVEEWLANQQHATGENHET